MGKTACKLHQKNVGANVQGTTRVHVPEDSDFCRPSAFGDHAVGREVESDDVRARRDAKIPDLWRMAALLEVCPQDVKEQMLMRLDEIDENYENVMARVISYTTNKAEQARGCQREATVPMELEYVIGSELYDEDWDHVDEVRRERRCYKTLRERLQNERQGQRERERRRQRACQRQRQSGRRSRKER